MLAPLLFACRGARFFCEADSKADGFFDTITVLLGCYLFLRYGCASVDF
jgi:hypothetical protein